MSDSRTTAPRADTLPEPGDVIADRYELLRRLGEGGMGAVYEARHLRLGRIVAVKFLRSELARHPEAMARFRREAQAAGTLQHENIVAVTDFDSLPNGAPFLVMELLAGEDLRARLDRERALSTARTCEIALQTCHGLAAAHARGVVHRDLKPENLFLARRPDGSDLVKILDFGIAKLTNPSGSGISTKTGAMIGTLHYMPPEQVRGDKALDERADVYALGAIIYECLSGTIPHPGAEPHVVLYHILNEPPVSLAALRPSLDRDLVELVHSMLSPDPAARPARAEAVAGLLARYPSSRPPAALADATHSGTSTTVGDSSSMADDTRSDSSATAGDSRGAGGTANSEHPAPARRRRTALVAAIALLGGGALIAAMDAAWAPDREQASEAATSPAASIAPATPPTPTPTSVEPPAPAVSGRTSTEVSGWKDGQRTKAPTGPSPRAPQPPRTPVPVPSRSSASKANPTSIPSRSSAISKTSPAPTPSRSSASKANPAPAVAPAAAAPASSALPPVRFDHSNPYE